MRLAGALLALILTIFGSAAAVAETKSILLITWRGMTPAEHGFMHRLKELGVDATFDHFDADRDETNLAGFLRQNSAKIKEMDLIYTFGTTATLTTHNFDIGTVPQVFNIVADPVGVGILSPHNKKNHGTTGAKLSLPPAGILTLLDQIHTVQRIAVLFDPREDNSTSEADGLTDAAILMGKQPVRLRFAPDSQDSEDKIASLREQLESVDAVYVTASSSYYAHQHLIEEMIPPDLVSVGSSTAYVDRGITLAIGTEYEERGHAAAKLAAKILLDDVPADTLPVDELKPSDAMIFVNKSSQAASALQFKNISNKIVYK